jgi:hypothetical protein
MQLIVKAGFFNGKNNTSKKPVRSITYFIIISIFFMAANSKAFAQPSAKDIRGAAPVVPLTSEAPPKLFVDPPLAEPLSLGRVVIQYRADNIHFVPVYGPGALTVSPRVGHVHVTVDNAPWHWADASGEPLILNGFPPGTHTVLIELAEPTHKIIDRKAVTFVVPDVKKSNTASP